MKRLDNPAAPSICFPGFGKYAILNEVGYFVLRRLFGKGHPDRPVMFGIRLLEIPGKLLPLLSIKLVDHSFHDIANVVNSNNLLRIIQQALGRPTANYVVVNVEHEQMAGFHRRNQIAERVAKRRIVEMKLNGCVLRDSCLAQIVPINQDVRRR